MLNLHLPPPAWVDHPKLFNQMIGHLSTQPRVAVDTASNSLHAYREPVCLIQFSTPEKNDVIHPLAIDDLKSLGPIFTSPNIEKIFHAAQYDLISLRRDFEFQVTNLFDTMHAARVL